MIDSYKTVLETGQAEIVEKKSRFIANVKPVQTEEEAIEFIEQIKKEHWSARHNVFAYQIQDGNNTLQRFTDDGEPSGTAGMPVLSVLKGEQINNVVVVITRYFGGTLLGTGGLVRAYGHCAKEGVLNAKIIQKEKYNKIEIEVEYTLTGKVQYEIIQNKAIILDTKYSEKVCYVVLVKQGELDKLKSIIINVTNGKVKFEFIENIYGALVDNEMKLFNY